ncbi:MAG: lipoyl(octanoyl) transferase LipB [Planctomycetota bacterium]|nr:lipoyl(octanoyl) transferase LipB [Planctomycetota bacterium]MDP6990518.1 lipoyl(octanoyl) transferase LipB [Planctomycetota bacterium]
MNEHAETLDVRRLGRTPYEETLGLQRELVERRIAGDVGDVLLLCEHDPVLTVGRGSEAAAVAETGLPVVEVERGGEATYHGPGQVVAYPILGLPQGRRDLHRYLRDLEEVAIRVLAEFGVAGTRREDLTGVWIGASKVCSIGVAVRRWVTWHGLALNVRTDLASFEGFHPCGLDPSVMTRLADHAELPPGTLLVEVLVIRHLCDVFGLELPPAGPPPSGERIGDSPSAGLPLFPGS